MSSHDLNSFCFIVLKYLISNNMLFRFACAQLIGFNGFISFNGFQEGLMKLQKLSTETSETEQVQYLPIRITFTGFIFVSQQTQRINFELNCIYL